MITLDTRSTTDKLYELENENNILRGKVFELQLLAVVLAFGIASLLVTIFGGIFWK